MKNIISQNAEMKTYVLSKQEALEKMKDEPYKIELIGDDELVSLVYSDAIAQEKKRQYRERKDKIDAYLAEYKKQDDESWYEHR